MNNTEFPFGRLRISMPPRRLRDVPMSPAPLIVLQASFNLAISASRPLPDTQVISSLRLELIYINCSPQGLAKGARLAWPVWEGCPGVCPGAVGGRAVGQRLRRR